jgi:alpha-amylase
MNRHGNGYDIYDLWDLGEFDQKGARSTKWGSIEELRTLIQTAKDLEMGVIWDTVISHKTGGDSTEEVWAVEVDKQGELSNIWGNEV